MKSSAWVLLFPVLCLVNADIQDNFRELYTQYSIHASELHAAGHDDYFQIASEGIVVECPGSVSPEKPTSVNKLRPGDINVIAALGDSLSTAYAADAPIFLPIMMNYLGVSASIGGNDNAAAVGTLPNIFKEYNPEIYGFSTGNGVPLTRPRNKQLNEAVVGAMADDMPTQAQRLVDRMKEDPNVDFENDWKFVTLFIGGNDLCSGCNRENSEPEAYIGFIEEAIQILYDNIPRTFVNVVGILNAYILKDLGGSLKCNLVHNIVCDCLDGSEEAEERMRQRTREYQKIVQEVIDSGKFDGKEDFTAVYQPFFHETVLPLDEDGEPDTSYFAPDCFHFSQKGQAAQALANWNSLFEPVGSKRLEWSPGEELNCPSEEFPYLYTNLNSARNSLSAEHGSENGGHLPVDSLSSGSPERVSKDAVIVMSVFGAIMVAVVCMAAAIYVRKRRVSTHSYQTL